MRTALLQLTSGDDPEVNLHKTLDLISEAANEGAGFVLTPEVSNCVSASRSRQREVLQHEDQDASLAAFGRAAADHGIWLLIGSLALKTNDPDGRFANRSFLIGPDGQIRARYDKIHMFDVQVSETETYRESAGYRPGSRAVTAPTDFARLGMTICYDVRFPVLYRQLALAGAEVITIPSAFSPVTGAAHWEALLRARAIETQCWVLAPAQTGTHPATEGRVRKTYGHSMAVSPWGDVVVDAGTKPGFSLFDLDLGQVAEARAKVPSLTHDRAYAPPKRV